MILNERLLLLVGPSIVSRCVQRLRKRIAIEEAVNEARRLTGDLRHEMKAMLHTSKPVDGANQVQFVN
jgi:aspartate aminotransferase-like enzyme